MPSVAGRILLALQARLQDIRGQGGMVSDLQGRVLLQRFGYDVDAEMVPCVFIARRVGGGTTRTLAPGAETLSDTTVVFDVVGVVHRSATSALAGEDLIADMQRALEIESDPFLRDDCLDKNLLSQELQLVTIDTGPPEDGFEFELVSVGVQCTYPHKYGDPDHVA